MRLKLTFLLLLSLCLNGFSNEWEPLLSPNLEKWEVFMGVPHKSVTLPDHIPLEKDKNNKLKPLGLNNDPKNVFSTYQHNNETILKISGEIYGGLTTKSEYSNYHFKCDFRWGTKKWAPRLNKKRDSGILFHAKGPHGKFWNVWMQSLECQVQEDDCGDFIALSGTRVDIFTTKQENSRRSQYNPKGTLQTFSGYVDHGPSTEYENGKWNTIEIITYGQTSIFIVNSIPNMVLLNTTYKNNKGEITPLKEGLLQIQSEGAEIEYKSMEIKPIQEIPLSLKYLLKKSITASTVQTTTID